MVKKPYLKETGRDILDRMYGELLKKDGDHFNGEYTDAGGGAYKENYQGNYVLPL